MCCIEENRKKFNKLINNTWKSTYQKHTKIQSSKEAAKIINQRKLINIRQI